MAFLDEILKLLQVGQAPTPRMAGMEQQVRGLFGQPNVEPYADPFFGGGSPGILANIPGPELQPQAPPQIAPATVPVLPPEATPSAMQPGMLSGGQLPDMGRFSSDYVPERDTGMIPGNQLPPGAMPASGPMPFGISPSGPASAAPSPAGPSAIPSRVAPQGPDMLGGLTNALGDMFRGTKLSGGIIGGMVAGQDRRQAANATIQFMKAKGVPDQDIALMMSQPAAMQAWLAQNMPIRRLPELIKDTHLGGDEKHLLERDPVSGALRVPKIEGLAPTSANVPKPPTGFQWADPNDKSKGYSPVPGGPATQLPAEAAGRMALMNVAQRDFDKARDVFTRKWTSADVWKETMAKAGVGMFAGDIGLARRNMRTAIEGALRAVTGAAAPDPEVDRLLDMYMPNAKDDIPSAKQKLKLLEGFMNEYRSVAMQGRTPTIGGPAASPIRTYNKSTGKFE